MKVLKDTSTPITEKLLSNLIGKFVHVPTNNHTVYEPMEKQDVIVNAWFAGKVAGYSKRVFAYDYETEKFFEGQKVVYSILLCDGMAYALSDEDCVIEEITEEEFLDMLAQHQAEKLILSQ